ncbi:MAG: hypothetical protein OET44_13125 [Gammaproteobacteria bacterium]|nr:hypothetical protein [Gammaproteobacteria bacterium]
MQVPTALKSTALLAALAGVLMLAGCDGDSEPTQALVVNMPMAVPAQYPTTGTVLAWMRLDGGSRIAMDVNTVNETVSGVLIVSAGAHTVEIIVEFDDDSLGILELARTILPVTVAGGTTTVSFVQNDYTYANNDNDTYPNVIELIAGSDPLDENSFPDNGSVPDSGRWNTMVWNRTNWR